MRLLLGLVFLVAVLFVVATASQTCPNGDSEVITLSLSSGGCANVQVGGRDLWLLVSLTISDLILFENGPHSHAQIVGTSYHPLKNTDVLSIGSMNVEMDIIFSRDFHSLGISTKCDGVLPLGQESGLWGVFKCFTFSGNFLYLGMCPLQGGFVIDKLTVTGRTPQPSETVTTEFTVRIDPSERHIQIPISNYLSLRGLSVKSPFTLVLPQWTFESDIQSTPNVITLGRSFFYIASLTVCQDPIISASNASSSLLFEATELWFSGSGSGEGGNLEGIDLPESSDWNEFVMESRKKSASSTTRIVRTISSSNTSVSHTNSITSFRHVSIMPFKCRAEDSGILVYIRITGATCFVMMLAWFFNRVETWASGFLGFKSKPQNTRGSPEFYPSSFLIGSPMTISMDEDIMTNSTGINIDTIGGFAYSSLFKSSVPSSSSSLAVKAKLSQPQPQQQPKEIPITAPNDGEIQLAWLFMMTLVLWNAGSVVLVHGRAMCLLCPVTWSCPADSLLPLTLQGLSNIFMIIMTPILTVTCIVIILYSRFLPLWSLTLVPAPQLGMAVTWLLTIPAMGDPIEILTWIMVTVAWNWITIWDAIVVTGSAVLIENTQDPKQAIHLSGAKRSKIMAFFTILESLLLLIASIASVYSPIFVFYGPSAGTLMHGVWLVFFVFVVTLCPPIILAIVLHLLSEDEVTGVVPYDLKEVYSTLKTVRNYSVAPEFHKD